MAPARADLAAELRVAADEASCSASPACGDGLHHGAMQIGDGGERPRRNGPLRHPRRVLEDAAERGNEGVAIRRH